jgi:hypothetical protein
MMPSIKCGCGLFYRVNRQTLERPGFFPRCNKCRTLAALNPDNHCEALTTPGRGSRRCKQLKYYNSKYCFQHMKKKEEE